MTAGTRRTVLKGLMSGAVAGPALASVATQAAVQGGPPPREWIDRKTGHRVVRVSPDEGGGKLYFYKNAWTPQGDLMAISTPGGIALVDRKTLRARLLVRNPRADLMFAARRSREIFYSISDPGEAQPMDRPRTVFAVDVDSGRERRV